MVDLHPPAIALVPGFLGFEHRGASTYFADRFTAGLRTVLALNGFVNVPVVSVSTVGVGSLRERQVDLLSQLRKLETATPEFPRLGGPRSWHLVGHSTGGVDAALLLREAPLRETDDGVEFDTKGWADASDLVARISSVTTLSAPHYGTGLAESPVARFLAHPTVSGFPVEDLASAARDFAFRRDQLWSRFGFALGALPALGSKRDVFHNNKLARDLRPRSMRPLADGPLRPSARGRVFSVATITPRPAPDHEDQLFKDLWSWTHDGAQREPALSASAAAVLDDRELRLPSQRRLHLQAANAGDNDGLVTSHLQLLGDTIAVVIGDHADVIGRYFRPSLVDDLPIDPGLLTSGARFRDEEFFELLLCIGGRIVDTLKSSA